MTATAGVTSLATRRIRARGPHPALVDALDRKLLALSARLAGHTITLTEATRELHDLYVRRVTQAAQAASVGLPEPVADAYVVSEATRAYLEVRVDEQRSAVAIVRAERRLGEVVVLPCGRREGARLDTVLLDETKPQFDPRDLW